MLGIRSREPTYSEYRKMRQGSQRPVGPWMEVCWVVVALRTVLEVAYFEIKWANVSSSEY